MLKILLFYLPYCIKVIGFFVTLHRSLTDYATMYPIIYITLLLQHMRSTNNIKVDPLNADSYIRINFLRLIVIAITLCDA